MTSTLAVFLKRVELRNHSIDLFFVRQCRNALHFGFDLSLKRTTR